MEGVYTAVVTPFDESGGVDKVAFSGLIKRQEEAGIKGVILAGTTGEGWSLSVDEIVLLYDIARKNYSGKIFIGTGAISTKETILKTQNAKNVGADGALVVVPYYNMPTEEGVIQHFLHISKVGIPIMAYHHPKRTGIKLSLDALERICAMESVVALKETSGDNSYISYLANKTNIFCGNDNEIKKTKNLGAKGVVSVISNVFPKETIEFFASNEADKRWFLAELIEKIFIEGNPAGIKWLCKKKNYCLEEVRLPLLSLSEKGIEEIERILGGVFYKEIANK